MQILLRLASYERHLTNGGHLSHGGTGEAISDKNYLIDGQLRNIILVLSADEESPIDVFTVAVAASCGQLVVLCS